MEKHFDFRSDSSENVNGHQKLKNSFLSRMIESFFFISSVATNWKLFQLISFLPFWSLNYLQVKPISIWLQNTSDYLMFGEFNLLTLIKSSPRAYGQIDRVDRTIQTIRQNSKHFDCMIVQRFHNVYTFHLQSAVMVCYEVFCTAQNLIEPFSGETTEASAKHTFKALFMKS